MEPFRALTEPRKPMFEPKPEGTVILPFEHRHALFCLQDDPGRPRRSGDRDSSTSRRTHLNACSNTCARLSTGSSEELIPSG